MTERDTPNTARVDLRITLAILVTITLEAVAGLLWIGAAAQRLDALEQQNVRTSPISERMARLETEMIALRTTLVRIETRLDRKEDR
ncbi:MAG: hypothetical protein MUF14_08250 [Hyphomonadaceae bacterium]|jgi:hypothetical protein|nr:hypothetical protein [Hyphomonadaceae bacterium]